MTTLAQSPTDAPGVPQDQCPTDTQELIRSVRKCSTVRGAYRVGLSYVAQRFSSPYATMSLDVDNSSLEEEITASDNARRSWQRHCDGMMLSSRYSRTTQAKFFRAVQANQTFAVLAVPLTRETDGVIGAMALVLPSDCCEVASARLSELQSVAALVGSSIATSHGRRTSEGSDTTSIAKIAAHKNLDEFCFAICNGLKTNLGCDQVSLGLVRKTSVDVVCVSGFDYLNPRSPGSRVIQQAMCECLDTVDIVTYQETSRTGTEQVPNNTGRLHKDWHDSTGASPVASIPLLYEEDVIAIVSLRNPAGSPFAAKQLKQVQELVTPMTSGLILLERANRSAVQRVVEDVVRLVNSFHGPGSFRRKLLAISAALVTCWSLTASTEYRLSSPCAVTATNDVILSAPFEGMVARALAQPGDRVRSGQILAVMDTRSLDAQRANLLAEVERCEVDSIRSMQSEDIATAAMADAERTAANAQIRMINRKRRAAQVLAPSRGVVLEAWLTSKVGEVMPIGEPLLRFAPEGNWRIALHVPEETAASLEIGQKAAAALSARPEVAVPCTIVRVEAATNVIDGENVVVAEAELSEAPPSWLRSGMSGVARVEVGRRPVWWVWAHRTLSKIRMQFWSVP